jgi:hypothetical protein
LRKTFLIAIFLFAIPAARSGELYERVLPAPPSHKLPFSIPLALATETKATVRDLATFRDPQWDALTIAQIVAAVADEKTSLAAFRHDPYSGEVGVSRLVVGVHPDAHKYVIAGVMEIGVEAVFAHYLHNHGRDPDGLHGPRKAFRADGEPASAPKWYWRALWALPQSISLYGHTRATSINLGHD